MERQTKGEALFESFCQLNGLLWQRVAASSRRTPDYRLSINGETVYFEVKDLEEDCAFRGADGVSCRTVGDHVRRRMQDARKQIQEAAGEGKAGVLLIYNNLDPMQRFGTKTHDFICAMYGEMTIRIKAGKATDSFHGRNSKLREDRNTSFSAVGQLSRTEGEPRIRIFENMYAAHPLKFTSVPECFELVRIELDDAA